MKQSYNFLIIKRIVLLKSIGLLFCALLLNYNVHAQQACATSGNLILSQTNYNNLVLANGDVFIGNSGIDPQSGNANWLLEPFANVQLMAALIVEQGAILRLKSGSRLSVYGDVVNKGHIIIEPDADLNFYGQKWTNTAGSAVDDGRNFANTLPGGRVNFIAPRPQIPAIVNASSCVLSNYNGGNFTQTIDGGNIAMDIVLAIKNNNNIAVENTPLRLEGQLVFGIDDGDVLVNDQMLIFNKNADYAWEIADVRNAFIITNNVLMPKNCAGMVAKEGIDSGAFFAFPIGRQEQLGNGQRDLSPILVQNLSSQNSLVQVDVKNYAAVQSIGLNTPLMPGNAQLDHLWRIETNGGGMINANMLHFINSTINTLDGLFVEPTSNPVYQIQSTTELEGDGPRGLGSGNGGVGGNVYLFPESSSTCDDERSWFFKEIESERPLFDLQRRGCFVAVTTQLPAQNKQNYTIEVWRNNFNDTTSFSKVGLMQKGKENAYLFIDTLAHHNANNHYFLKWYESGSLIIHTDTAKIYLDCSELSVFPNPTDGISYVNGLKPGLELVLYSMEGKRIMSRKVVSDCETIDLSPFAAGVYNIVVFDKEKQVATLRVAKQ